MQVETRKKQLLRWLLYLSFFGASFLLFLYMTFPYDLVLQRATLGLQSQAKMRIKVETLSPYWLTGVQAQNLELKKATNKGIANIYVKALTARVSILPLLTRKVSASFNAEFAGGMLRGSVNLSSKQVYVKGTLDNVQLSKIGPKPGKSNLPGKGQFKDDSLLGMLFATTFGKISGDVDLKLPLRKLRGRTIFDITKASGKLNLQIKGLLFKDGSVPHPQMGDLAFSVLDLGTVSVKATMKKGRVQFSPIFISGGEIGMLFRGRLNLRRPTYRSFIKGKLQFKFSKQFFNRKKTQQEALAKGFLQGQLGGRRKNSKGYYSCPLHLPFRGRARCNIR